MLSLHAVFVQGGVCVFLPRVFAQVSDVLVQNEQETMP